MFQRIVPEVLEKYGVAYTSVRDVQKGYRNESYAVDLPGGDMVNLMFFKREPHILSRIRRADATSHIAAAGGLPVRTRFDERLMRLRTNTYAGLYTYLPGRTIAWEMYSMKHIKLLGWAMGDLHAALTQMVPIDSSSMYDELDELVVRMRRYFSDSTVEVAADEKLGVRIDSSHFHHYVQLISSLRLRSGQQMLHMDMVRGNVLFDGAQPGDRWQIDGTALTGIIDFEKAAYGHPICDIARTLAFLLVDCPKPGEKTYKYFLESGYSKRAERVVEHRDLLEPLVTFFLLHDFYKFLRHTPYESLADNYHYVRTRDLLKNYGMISLKN